MKSFMREEGEPVGLESYHAIMDVNVGIYAELDKRRVSFRELVSLDVDSLVPF